MAAFGALCIFGLTPVWVAAQIVPNPNAGAQKPTVATTPSGIPLVQISRPSAAGVSNNQYDQFSVGRAGAVLNNSPTSIQSQLAGWIPGNANLTSPAKIILNQVTGNLPSMLAGQIEVAGRKAEVVIANSAGITCSGCGFINTSRGILTTGMPVIGPSGSLDAFRVTSGTVSLTGAGLNASNLDQVDVIARAVSVNASVYANSLNVVTGANQVDHSPLAATPITGTGTAPSVSVDVSQLGGMYAQHIWLVGTERGVGVNDAGTIAAQSGDLTLSTQGKLVVLGNTNASGNLNLSAAGGVGNSGSIYGLQSATVNSPGDVSNSGTIAGQAQVVVNGANVSSTGSLAAGVDASGNVSQSGDLIVVASNTLAANGRNIAGGNATLQGASLDLSGSTTTANGNLSLLAQNGDANLTGANTSAGQRVDINAPAGTVRNDAERASELAQINAAQININAAGLSNKGGLINQTGTADTSIQITGEFDNSGGTLTTNASDLALRAGSIANAGGKVQLAGSGKLTVTTGPLNNQSGVVASNGALSVQASGISNQGGAVSAVNAATVASTGSVSNVGGSIDAGGALNVSAASLDNTQGRIAALGADRLTVNVSRQLINAPAADGSNGLIGGNGATVIAAGSLTNSGTLNAATTLGINVANTFDNSKGIASGQTVQVQANDLVNKAGVISQSGADNTTVSVAGSLNNSGGTLETNGQDLTISSGSLNNGAQGSIAHSGTGALEIQTGAMSNSGAIATNGDATVNATTLANSGTVSAQRTLGVTAVSINNNGGSLASVDGLTVQSATQLTNTLGTIRSGTSSAPATVAITAGKLDNSQGVINAGSASIHAVNLTNLGGKITQSATNGTATLDVSNTLDNNSGSIQVAAVDLALTPQTLTNVNGTIAHAGNGTLGVQTGALDNDGGVLGTNGASAIVASSVLNRGGQISAVGAQSITGKTGVDNGALAGTGGYIGGASVAVSAQQGSVTNTGAMIEAATGPATLNAQALDNNSGTVHALGKGAVTVTTSGAVSNRSGMIGGNGDVSINAAQIDSTAGTITALGQLNVASQSSLTNDRGAIISQGGLSISTPGAVSNIGGEIDAGGPLVASAGSLDNSQGRIVSLGTGAMTLNVAGQLSNAPAADSSRGVIGSNGAASITAGSLTNSGTLSAATDLGIAVTNTFDNSGGTASGQSIQVQALNLINNAGVVSQSGMGNTIVSVAGSLDNSSGTLQSNGQDFTISSGSLTNGAQGTIAHAGTGTLDIKTGALSNAGSISGNGAAAVSATTIANSGTVSAQRTLDVAGTAVNNNGGTLASVGALTVQAGTRLTNAGGTIQSGTTTAAGAVTITADELDNSDGWVNAASASLHANNLTNAGGKIAQTASGGIATLDVANTLDNTGGSIQIAATDFSMTPQTLINANGSIMHSGSGSLNVATGVLDNDSGVIATNGMSTVNASSVSNRGGQISALGAKSLIGQGGVDNSMGGYIGGSSVTVSAGQGAVVNTGGTIEAATGAATVSAQSIDNNSGTVHGLGSGAVAVVAAEALSNRAGTIGGAADVSVNAASIDNTSGTMAALGNLGVASQSSLTNDGGTIATQGNLAVAAAGAVSNVAGKIESLGATSALTLAGSSIDNTNGVLTNAGTAQTSVNATGAITNAGLAAVIGGNGDVAIAGANFSNTQGAQTAAGGALTLTVPGSVVNDDGQLVSGGTLTLNEPSASLSNVGGTVSGGNVALTTASLNNTNGQIANPLGGTGTVTISTGTLENGGGSVGSGGDLAITANALTGNGKIIGGHDATVSLQGDYTYNAGNLITANHDLKLSTSGTFTNEQTLSAAGGVTVSAANIVNTAGADIVSGTAGDAATGQTTLIAGNGAGDINNAGRIEGNTVTTISNTLENTATIIGGTINANANTLTNDGVAAIIAGTEQANLWVPGTINNQNGATVYSLGDVNMAANSGTDANGTLINQAGTINNLSSTIEAGGNLDAAANQINNVRQNIQTTTTTSTQTYVMKELPWWHPGQPGNTAPFQDANTNIQTAYYVNPSDIVSSTPVVTPDGYIVQRVVVNLPANASVFQWQQSGLTYGQPNGGGNIQYGQQLRVDVAAGQVVLYVYSQTTDQSNPDQTGGGNAFPDHSLDTVSNQLGTISYSNQYGDCTTSCVRLETYPGYTDPTTQIIKSTEQRRAGSGPGSYPTEVERQATQTVAETTLSAGSGAPALMTAGSAMNLVIGSRFNNDNGTVAAGGDLNVNQQQVVNGTNGSSNAAINNTSAQLSTTYSFSNRSGYSSPWASDPTAPVQWVTWTNPSITQNTGIAGGTITSNQTVSINGGDITNSSVSAASGVAGASAQALGLGNVTLPGAVGTGDTITTAGASGSVGTAGSAGASGSVGGTGTAGAAGSAANGAQGAVTTSTGTINATGGATAAAAVSGAVRKVDGARAALLSPVLPTSGLYKVSDTPGQSYLVQTDPRFTSYGTFISSDYMLNLLGINPEQTQKRLGDGFYETQLVQNQVTSLTGRKYLPGDTSAEQQYRQLMLSSVAVQKQFSLQPGVALTDAQMAALTEDIVWLVNQTVTMPDGTRQTVLVPQVYLAKTDDATLSPTGALIAGNSVGISGANIMNNGGAISSTQNTILIANNDIQNIGGLISGGNVGMQAGHDIVNRSVTDTEWSTSASGVSSHTSIGPVAQIQSSGTTLMNAGNDITVQGAQITAGAGMGMSAGHAVNIAAAQTGSDVATQAGKNTEHTVSTQAAGSTISAGGNLGVVSGGDINVAGSQLNAGGSTVVAGAGNVSIVSATNTSTNDGHGESRRAWETVHSSAETNAASSLSAGGNVTVLAGAQPDANGNLVLPVVGSAPAKDLTLQGSSIVAGTNGAGNSQVLMGATGDVNMVEAHDKTSFSDTSHSSSKSLLSRSTTDSQRTFAGDNATGSLVSGDSVAIGAGHDINVRGSAVVGTDVVALQAGQDVNITTSQSTDAQSSGYQSSKSGLMGSGGLGVTIGSRSLAQTDQSSSVTNHGSTIGASAGDVSINAGHDVTLTGSQVVAGQDVAIKAQNVTVNAAYDAYQDAQTQRSKQSGLTVGIGGGVLDTAQTMVADVKSGTQSGDSRLAAVQGLAAAEAAYQNRGQIAGTADALASGGNVANASGVQLQLSIGSSQNDQASSTSISTARGSSIVGNNNVSITATGGNGAAGTGDITMTDANVMGRDVDLWANNDVTLKSAQSTQIDSSTNGSNGWNAGVGIGVSSKGGAGISVFANGYAASGHGNGESVTQEDTTVAAGNALTIHSGRDTTLDGALASGNAVSVDVGRDLTMTSEKDTSNYAERQSSAGGGLSYTFGAGGLSGSASASRTKIDSNFDAVGQQTGIVAGEGGFDVNVAGHTQLNGAQIASSAAAKNTLTTGSFSYSDIANTFESSGSTTGVTLNSGTVGGPQAAQTSDNANGTTYAAISPATITVRADDVNGTDSTAGLSRDTSNANQTVQNTFNLRETQNDLAFAQAFGKTATYAMAEAAGSLAKSNPEVFGEGKPGRDAMHAAVAAIGAAISGGNIAGAVGGSLTGDALTALAKPIIDQAVSGLPAGSQQAARNALNDVVAAAGGAAAGALAGGQGALAGAGSASNNQIYNRQLHPDEKQWIKTNAAAYAKQNGITVDQAASELTAQADRQLQNGSSGAWNQTASAFLSQAHGMLPADGNSGPGYMFYATPDQKANPNMYAGYYPNGTGLNKPAAADIAGSATHDAASRDALANQTWGAAAAAGGLALAGPVGALPGAPIFSSGGALGSGTWASSAGTGAISAGINAGSQYYQNGKINLIDVGIAGVSGGVGVYGGLGWNIAVNALGGATGTGINNAVYGQNNSVIGSGITSGVLSSLGYGMGKLGESGVNTAIKPTINGPNWAATGVLSGSGWNMFGPNNFSTIGGSVGGASGQEIINGIYQRMQNQPGVGR
ncbi:hemagglutinin repeat-containing protein [Caballeronia sordidicola]|uniref:Large exoprotein involved in heme utilization or adhesion of ShlA/HecA/FhaA family n=1 Tax=Caballeronia sordidicola TaxID=196367 RepID=A0A226WZ77_CABSO|nr:hemagglutinin repeat-containing protein [Caballeronia sordidicola]OXC75918.1 Large exoprotein involved in heme utilization or adhesion of ShlA/HecA/FhaA family [Caballeronia sordidicola]